MKKRFFPPENQVSFPQNRRLIQVEVTWLDKIFSGNKKDLRSFLEEKGYARTTILTKKSLKLKQKSSREKNFYHFFLCRYEFLGAMGKVAGGQV